MKVRNIFEDEDIKLLNEEFPENPCKYCGTINSTCCGCPERTLYVKKEKMYKNRGIYTIAFSIKRLKDIEMQMKTLKKEYNEQYEYIIKAMGEDIDKLDILSEEIKMGEYNAE